MADQAGYQRKITESVSKCRIDNILLSSTCNLHHIYVTVKYLLFHLNKKYCLTLAYLYEMIDKRVYISLKFVYFC